MKKNIGQLFIIILIILVVTFGAYYFLGRGSILGQRKTIKECSLSLKDEIGLSTDVIVDNAQCTELNKGCIGFWGYNWFTDWFITKGTIDIYDRSGKLVTEEYTLNLLGKDTITTQICSSDNTFTIRVYDKNGVLLDEEVV